MAMPRALRKNSGSSVPATAPSSVPAVQPKYGVRISPNRYFRPTFSGWLEATAKISSVLAKLNSSRERVFMVPSRRWPRLRLMSA